MTVRVYRWDDASAPTVDNNAGDLLNLLDKCLVTGYGAKAGSGWGKPFSGTNKAVFRAPSGNRHYLRVDNTDPTTALLTGYEAMTDVDTGTGAFPTVAQGTYVRHQCDNTANTTPRGTNRGWVLVATQTMFHLWMPANNLGGPTANYDASITTFGEFTTFKTGDAYHTVLAGSDTNNFATTWGLNSNPSGTSPGIIVPRTHLQTGTAVGVSRFSDYAIAQAGSYGAGGLTYPHPPDGGLYLAPVFLGDSNVVRGLIPGLWNPCHTKPLENFDTFSGSGTLAGKTFIALNGNSAQIFLETSNTW